MQVKFLTEDQDHPEVLSEVLEVLWQCVVNTRLRP